MTEESSGPSKKQRDPFFVGVEAALRRAATVAHRRAIETSGSVPISKDGEIVYVTTFEGFSEEELTGADQPGNPPNASSQVTTG